MKLLEYSLYKDGFFTLSVNLFLKNNWISFLDDDDDIIFLNLNSKRINYKEIYIKLYKYY